MASYRRTNEPSPLEVEGSTAGASGGRDLGEVDVWEKLIALVEVQFKLAQDLAQLVVSAMEHALMDEADKEIRRLGKR